LFSAGRRARTAVVAAVAVTALVAAIIVLAGKSSLFHSGPAPTAAVSDLADQVIYTARTANDAAITLPGMVHDDLVKAGQAHQSIELDEVSYSGDVSASFLDMTPRTGGSSQDPVLRLPDRANQAIEAKISAVEAAVNDPAGAAGGHALYDGLTKADLGHCPVIIVSSGLDLSNPDDFRMLKWSVPAAKVVAQLKNSGDLPALHGPVIFVLVPTTGSQPQLGQAQKDYLESIWTALLKAGGATSVTFIDAEATTATAPGPAAPTVPVPGPPPTPIPQVPVRNGEVRCTLPDSQFIYNEPTLVNAAQTEAALTPCIRAALAEHATFALDGFASYEGPLNAAGQPEVNEPSNITLSRERVKTIATLLVDDLMVPSSDITHMVGHGNADQPDPGNPRSSDNRVVQITYIAH
jgi:hypothetical protein